MIGETIIGRDRRAVCLACVMGWGLERDVIAGWRGSSDHTSNNSQSRIKPVLRLEIRRQLLLRGDIPIRTTGGKVKYALMEL